MDTLQHNAHAMQMILWSKLSLPVESDLHFCTDKSRSAYTNEARAHGRTVT
jgi:hypothetical protein